MKRKSHIMGLYTDGFRQVWPIGFMGAAAAAVCAVAESPYGPVNGLFQGIQAALVPFRLLYLVAVAVMVFRLFLFVGNRQAVDFYFSTPLKRSHIYTANVIAAVTWIVIMTGAYVGARFITDWFLPGMGNGNIEIITRKFLADMWGWGLSVFGTCLLILGGCCLGVTVAGSMAGGAVLTAVILLLPVILRVTFLGQLGQSMEFVPMEHSVWIALDTTYGLLHRSYDVQTEDGAIMLSLMLSGLYSGCIGMACCAAGDLVYRRRKGEAALRSVGKRILALGGGIVLTAAAMTAVFAAAASVIPRLEAAITPEGEKLFSVSIYDVTDVADMAEICKGISLDFSLEVMEVVRGEVQEEMDAFRHGQEYYQNWLAQQGGETHTVILRGENGPLYRDIHFRAEAYGKLVEALKGNRRFSYANVDLRDFDGMRFGDDYLYPPGQRAPEKLYCGMLGDCLPPKSLKSLYKCMVDELMTEEVYNAVSGQGLPSNSCPLGKLALKKRWADTEGVFDFLECVTENGDKLALPISPKTPRTLERLAAMVNSRCESDIRTFAGRMERDNIGRAADLSLLLYTGGNLYITWEGALEKAVETGSLRELGEILHNVPRVFHADRDILVVRCRDTGTEATGEEGGATSPKSAWYNLTGEQSRWILENWDMKPYVRASYAEYDLPVERYLAKG